MPCSCPASRPPRAQSDQACVRTNRILFVESMHAHRTQRGFMIVPALDVLSVTGVRSEEAAAVGRGNSQGVGSGAAWAGLLGWWKRSRASGTGSMSPGRRGVRVPGASTRGHGGLPSLLGGSPGTPQLGTRRAPADRQGALGPDIHLDHSFVVRSHCRRGGTPALR